MRSILVLLILVMIGLNGKGQSVTALPDSVLSQCCLEVTLLNGNVTTVDWVFIQYITRDGTGTKLFVEYAPNFGGIQWETQIRIQDDFDDVLERSKFIVIPFTVGSTDYGINRNWIANIEENTTTGGTWIYGRFGTPTKRKFSAVEDYEALKNLLLACRPRAIVVAENGLYTEGDTVRMGGFLIEPTTITTEGYNWMMKDTLSKTEFGIDYSSVFGDTVSYMARRWGKWRNIMHVGRRYFISYSQDTTGVTGIESSIEHSYFASTDDPYVKISTQSGSGGTLILNRFQVDNYQGSWSYEDNNTNPYYSHGVLLTSTTAQLGSGESGTGDPGNGVAIGTYGFGVGADEYVFLRTKGIDNSTATVGQFLQLQNATTGKSEWATIDLSAYLPIADTAAMLTNYVTFGNLSGYPTGTGTADRLARWTATNTLAAGNLSDNGTKLQALLPWQFHSWTTAGRPTGVNNYWGYNSTIDWLEGYLTSAGTWVSPLQSSLTGGKGTATRLLFNDANGRATDDAAFTVASSQMYVNGIKIGLGNGAVSQNMAIGFESMNATATGNFNTGVGYRTLYSLGGGTHNSAFGRLALFAVTSGTQNMGFGAESLSTCTTCQSNVAVGYNALKVNNKDFNVAIGRNALVATTGSDYNTAIGDRAMVAQSTNTLGRNVAIGAAALSSANTSLTVAIGESSLSSLTTGTGMVAIGRLSGASETTNSNKLHIANTNTKSLIYGDFSTDQVILNATWPPTLKSSVALELISTNKGFLPPVMTNAQRIAISSAATGLQVFTTDATEGMYVKLAAGWKRFLVDGDAATTWLKTELEASRDVDITGGTSTDFRLRSNTRVQFDGKFKLGADSSLYYDPPGKALVLVGSAGFQPSIYQANTYNSFTRAKFEEYDFRAMYSTFSSANGYNFTRGLSDSRIGTQWPLIHKVDSSALLNGWGIINIFGSSFGGRRYQHIFEGGSDEDELYLISRSDIQGRRAFTIRNDLFAVNVFWVTNEGKIIAGVDSTLKYDPNTDLLQLSKYGTGIKEAGDVSKTQSNYITGLATDGTILDLERKRDTTIYVDDADCDFSAALTTAQISRRYNRVIFWMTTTAGAGSDSELTLHTPDANLMQVEYLIHSVDEAGGFDNRIIFGTNNAVDSTNGLVANYYPSAGQGVHIRAGLRSGVYKYRYSN